MHAAAAAGSGNNRTAQEQQTCFCISLAAAVAKCAPPAVVPLALIARPQKLVFFHRFRVMTFQVCSNTKCTLRSWCCCSLRARTVCIAMDIGGFPTATKLPLSVLFFVARLLICVLIPTWVVSDKSDGLF